MAEISLPKQLSGSEALESMLAELHKTLSRNGRFASHMAYSGYRAEIDVRFYPAASFVPPVEQTVEIDAVQKDAIVSQTATVSESIEIPVRPPNKVREDANMPTPVLTMDAQGNMVERMVKRANQVPVPKNKVHGGSVGYEPAVTMVPTTIPVKKNATI
jgi:hypothetical protein